MAAITVGTDRQVDYAHDIRTKLLRFLKAEMDRRNSWPTYPEMQARYDEIVAVLDTKTEATWWIEKIGNSDRLTNGMLHKIIGG